MIFHALFLVYFCKPQSKNLVNEEVDNSERERERKKSDYNARKSVQLRKKVWFPLHRNTRRDKVKTQKAEKDERDYDLVKKESKRDQKSA